jgi:hypothetical protein
MAMGTSDGPVQGSGLERWSLARVILALAAATFAAACQAQPLVRDPGSDAGGSPGTGAGGTTGAGGALGTGGGASGGIDGMTCGRIDHPTQPIPPDMLILLDASGSMNDDATNTTCNGGCGASSKWAAATAAINTVVAETEGSINWGLKMFADADASCGVGNGVAVTVGAANAAAVAAAITGRTSANGGVANGSRTPTRLAENAATAYLLGLPDMSPKYVLLVTDGLPNCIPGGADPAADDSAGAVAAVTAAQTAGIPTMVVGVATSGLPVEDTLNAMAAAGGYPRAGSPSYYPADSSAELASALRAIVGGIPSCIFSVPPPPNSNTFTGGFDVFVGGMAIPRDVSHTSGWDIVNPNGTAIQLYGAVCDDIESGKVTTVSVIFRCLI